jgi:transcriptional regulator with XRE-family HTH domain
VRKTEALKILTVRKLMICYIICNMPSHLLKVRRIRQAQGYSLRHLAQKVGMSHVTLFRLEIGETDPRLGTLRKVAKALNITVADLIAEGKPARRQAKS